MQDARVVRRLIAMYVPAEDKLWKMATGVQLQLDSAISNLEARLTDLKKKRDAIHDPLEKFKQAIRAEKKPSREELRALLDTPTKTAKEIRDFDVQYELVEKMGEIRRLLITAMLY